VRRLAVVGLLVAALLAGACGNKDKPLGPTATVPQATTTTDPYAVPAVIDEAYVNRVLAGLDHSVGEVARIALGERAITKEVADRLKALYVGEFLDLSVASLQADIRNGFATYRDDPGDQRTIVTELLHVTPSCVFTKATRDYSAVSNRQQTSPTIVWIAIQPSEAVNVQASPTFNPTRWLFIFDGHSTDEMEPADPCST
jgi:hypothetical protein